MAAKTNKKDPAYTQDPSYTNIQDAMKYAAKAANLLDACDAQLQIAFYHHKEWNDEVKYLLQEVQAKLCPVLGCLATWWDEDEEKEKK